MNFLIDAQLPPALCGWLRERGHDATHIFDIGMTGASDIMIAERAATDDAALISKDEDFLALRLPDRFVLLWLRCGNATTKALFAWLQARWPEVEMLLARGERLVEMR